MRRLNRLVGLIGLDLVDLGILFVVGILLGTFATGCALSTSAAGATTAQKLQDDMAAIKQIELDVKTQCGPQFAPLAVQAGAILSIAEAAANVSAGNVAGAVGNAASAFPTVMGDAQGLACVVKVLETDYQKYKPKTAAWLMRLHPTLEEPAAYRQLLALVDVPPICDSGNVDGGACRAVTVDDEFPMTMAVPDPRFVTQSSVNVFCNTRTVKSSARSALISR